MHILCTGLNHNKTRLDLRERLAFTEEQACNLLKGVANGSRLETVPEFVLISTCNRTEAYAVTDMPADQAIGVFLAQSRGMDYDELQPNLYTLSDYAAVEHLFYVASGLDSLVLGEPQILGQVGHALELAQANGTAGPVLTRLFQAAVHAGKRARAETEIGRNPASIASLAAGLSAQAHPNLPKARVVIVGAGEMAELAVEALRKRGVQRILVINRRLERARALADRWQAEAATFKNLVPAISQADVVIASTGAPHTIIHLDTIRKAMEDRRHRPLVLVDIAVPRDVDPDVGALESVRLYDLDDLKEHLEHSLAERRREVPRVEAILADEVSDFLEFFHAYEVLPVISELHQWADSVRQAELDKTLRKLPDLSDAERRRIEAMTQALVRKLLDRPTRSLRSEATCPHSREHAHAVRSLFGLTDSGDGRMPADTGD